MVFNVIFNNITVISWRSVLFVEKLWVPEENHRPVANHVADNSIEKNLARRQLIVKSNESSSWLIEIKYILRKYNLREASWYLDNFPKKSV
jgi:hypothetical protein